MSISRITFWSKTARSRRNIPKSTVSPSSRRWSDVVQGGGPWVRPAGRSPGHRSGVRPEPGSRSRRTCSCTRLREPASVVLVVNVVSRMPGCRSDGDLVAADPTPQHDQARGHRASAVANLQKVRSAVRSPCWPDSQGQPGKSCSQARPSGRCQSGKPVWTICGTIRFVYRSASGNWAATGLSPDGAPAQEPYGHALMAPMTGFDQGEHSTRVRFAGMVCALKDSGEQGPWSAYGMGRASTRAGRAAERSLM